MTETVAQLRFARDKRGYEYFALVRPATGQRRRGQSRILYWYRTPPGVKVGRVPFDDEVRRMIETQNPGVRFDWARLIATPIPAPSADVERWRERRRSERAVRREQSSEIGIRDSGLGIQQDTEPGATVESHVEPTVEPAVEPGGTSSGQTTPSASGDHTRRRRRRRGGWRHGGAGNGSGTSESQIPNPGSRSENPESRPANPETSVPNPES